MTPNHLRTESLENPLGLDERHPRLSWLLESQDRNKLQSAYHLVVASSLDRLESGRADLWDSGQVRSSAQNHIAYAGKPLESRQICYWRVRVWDEAGTGSEWSSPARWEMGLLETHDWQATWIGLDQWTLEDEPMPCPHLRSNFQLSARPIRARLYATARGVYEAHLNGARIGDALLAPGWTDYHQRIQYQSYDVTELLEPGDNVLGAILGDGWYCGRIGFKGERRNYGSRPQLLAQLEVTLENGERFTLCSNGAWGVWKASTGPLLYSDFLDGERYDARLELPGWNAPGFDDSAWRPVLTFSGGVALVAQVDPPIRRRWTLPPVSVSSPAPGVHIFDLGQNIVGWVRLRVRGVAGQEIRLKHAEMLEPGGTLYTEALRRARATDVYLCQGEELETYEPRFTFHGFRYVEVTGLADTPALETLQGIVIGSDTPEVGEFECSSELVGTLWRNVRWGQRGNFLSVPTDCPQRDERLGWLGDAQVFVRTASYNADVSSFFTKWMADVLDAQSPAGGFPDVAPRLVTLGEGSPAWGDAGVIIPWTLWQVYGDTRILERCWDAMTRWMGFIAEANPNGLWLQRRGSDFGDWLAQDGENPANAFGSKTPKDLLASAYWAYDARLMVQIAGVLGKGEEAKHYQGLLERIKTAFCDAYLGEDGWLEGHTQTGQTLALHFDLVPQEARARVADRLVEAIEARGGHLTTGFVGVSYLLPTLEATGHCETAYKLLLNETFPSWGYSIKNGATTIWERWDGWTLEKGFQDPMMNSFNHYSLGSVVQWLYSSVAGIEALEPGFARIRFKPQPGGGLSRARASYLSVRGRIECAWTLEEGSFTLSARVPPNTTAQLLWPYSQGEVFEGGHAVDQVAGITTTGLREGRRVLELESGVYHFSSALQV